MTPKWPNDARMTGMKSRKTSFFQWIWDDGNDRNALWMTEIIILTSFLSFQQNVIPRHSNARMTIEWMKWHPNDSIFTTWTMVDGMTLEWRNDIQMMEWHSNDGMTLEWWNDIQMMKKYQNDDRMTEWYGNDDIVPEWAKNDRMTYKWWNITGMR